MPLHPHSDDRALRALPAQQVTVAVDGGRELPVGQVLSDRVDHLRCGSGRECRLAGDLRAVVRHVRRRESVPGAAAPVRGWADETMAGLLDRAPMRSRAPVRPRAW